jgi:hypothetical protein
MFQWINNRCGMKRTALSVQTFEMYGMYPSSGDQTETIATPRLGAAFHLP